MESNFESLNVRWHLDIPAGQVWDGHEHPFFHLTLLFGDFILTAKAPDGTVFEYESHGRDFVGIRPEFEHSIKCLTDGGEFWCVYSERLPQSLVEAKKQSPRYKALLAELIALANEENGDIVQYQTGWTPAYHEWQPKEVAHG